MDLMLLRTFQMQAALQCNFVMLAANEINDALKEGNIDRLYYAIQNLLNAGANLSKIFWGAGGKLARERAPVRESIGVSNDSPLKQVTMRNNFEHMDERLDRWWNESKNHNYVDMNIGSKQSGISGVDQKDMFRFYDPYTAELTFWGEEFNILKIVNEVQELLPKLTEEASKPHWE